MSVHIDIHNAHEIQARASRSPDGPLTLSIRNNRGDQWGHIMLWTDSAQLTRALADAINAAVEAHKAKQKEVA